MRILMVSQFHYNQGGVETYFFQLMQLLKSKGHEVIPLSMNHEKNLPSPYSKYFVSKIDYVDSLNHLGLATGVKAAARSIYSLEARKKINLLIKDMKPDLAHFQAIHNHLTPSIIYVLKKYNIPIVWTLHDYKFLLCPNNNFFNDRAAEACQKCKKFKYYRAVLTRCKKNSIMASFLAALEAYIHRTLRIHRLVDKFISPSKFLIAQLLEYGLGEKRVSYLPNFIPENGSSFSSKEFRN